jgi:hypothetical protein
MPDAEVLQAEERRESAAESAQADAEFAEDIHDGDLDLRYAAAASAWWLVADDYSAKSREARGPEDWLRYVCRAGIAWWNTARAYAKAAAYTPMAAVQLRANARDAYQRAADFFERCASRLLERGQLIRARGELESAQVCYERCGKTADAERVGTAAAAIDRAMKKGN